MELKNVTQFIPLILSSLVGVLFSFAIKTNTLNFLSEDILTSVLSFEGILIGFLMTSQSLLGTIDNKEIIRWHKEAGTYSKLILCFTKAIGWSFIAAVTTIIVLVLNGINSAREFSFIYTGIWSFSVFMSIILSYKVSKLFADILSNKNP